MTICLCWADSGGQVNMLGGDMIVSVRTKVHMNMGLALCDFVYSTKATVYPCYPDSIDM